MGFLKTAVDLLTWRTELPPPRPARRTALSPDFVEYRQLDVPAYSSYYSQSLANAIDPEMVRDAFVKISTIYGCIRLIANAAAEAPIKVYQRTDRGKAEEVPDHEVSLLLEEPNPEMAGPEFRYAITTIGAVCGYTILEHVRARTGLTAELYPRVPDRWTRRKRTNGAPYWEVIGNDGRRREVRPEDVTLVPYEPHPKLRSYGITPIKVIEREAGIEDSLTAFLVAYLDRGAIIPHVLTTDQPIFDRAHVAQMQLQWQQYQAGGAIDKPPILSGGLKVQQVGGTVDQMAWPDLRGITELKICQAFNVQPHLVGAKDAIQNGGLSTTELGQAMTFMQQYTAGPLRKRQAGALTRGVLREFEEDRRFFLAHDDSQILALQEEQNKRHERARADLVASGTTLDEYRAETGRDPLPNGRGNVRLLPFNVMELPIDEDAPEPAPPPARSARALKEQSLTAIPKASLPRYSHRSSMPPAELEFRASVVRTNRNRQEQLARSLDPKLRRFFRDQGRRITGTLQRAATAPDRKADETLFTRMVKGFMDIDWQAEFERLAALLEPHYNRTAEQAVADVNAIIGSDAIWELANPYVQEIYGTLGQRIVGISETTRHAVAKEIYVSLDEGVTIEEVVQNLQGLFEETYRNRSKTIARTESQVAYNAASSYGYRESGEVDEVELFDNPDHTEDYGASDGLTCAQRDGLIVPLSAVQRHIDGEHPNGSMAVAPIVRKIEDTGRPATTEPEPTPEPEPIKWSGMMERDQAEEWAGQDGGVYKTKAWYHFTNDQGATGIPDSGLKQTEGVYGTVGYLTEDDTYVLGASWAKKRLEMRSNVKNPLVVETTDLANILAEVVPPEEWEEGAIGPPRNLTPAAVKALQKQGYDSVELVHPWKPGGGTERWLLTFDPESTTVVNVDDTPDYEEPPEY